MATKTITIKLPTEESLNIDLTQDGIQTLAGSSIGLNLNMGTPDQNQLDKIHYFTEENESSKDDWFVVPFLASYNTLSRSLRSWHPNLLQQMQENYPGCELILNHDSYDVSKSVGFIFDSKLIRKSVAPVSVNRPENQEINDKIVKSNGFIGLVVWAAIKTDMRDVIEGIKSRRLHNCSTGGLLYNARYICPHCTEDLGREIDFRDEDEKGMAVCPHDPPGMWWGDSDWAAEYMIVDGTYDSLENSIVQAGNLPGASIIRSGSI